MPLSGLLVADFSRVLAGPLCSMMLADAGARVIKVEPPGGDETRRWGPPFVGGESSYFLSINRNKESVVVDLTTSAGLELARCLVQRSDVLLENFRPKQRDKFGFSATAVRQLNPRIIHCSILGFEPGSPEADLPGYDLLAQASSGLMSITGESAGPPVKSGVAISDILTAHYAHGAICASLYARERSGQGATIDVSLIGATTASLVNVAQNVLVSGEEATRHGNAHPSIVPYQIFEAADRSFALAVGTDRQFVQLCSNVLERPDMALDDRFTTNQVRVRHRETLVEILGAIFRGADAASWVERCRGADVPASLVSGVLEMLQGSGSTLVTSVEHSTAGKLPLVGSPIRREGSGAPVSSPPPRLGEHTDAIRKEFETVFRESL